MESQSRVWSFTINNPTEQDIRLLQKKPDKCLYLCYSHEVGKEGTPHIQGALQWSSRVGRLTISRYLPRAYIEASQGVIVAGLYTMKDLYNGRQWCWYNSGKPVLQQADRRFLKGKDEDEDGVIRLMTCDETEYCPTMGFQRWRLMKDYPGFVHHAFSIYVSEHWNECVCMQDVPSDSEMEDLSEV